jgi:molybdate transport system substrate-binding protein
MHRYVLGAGLLFGLLAPAPAFGLRVYAASSLREAFPAIDDRPQFNFDGSNRVQMQIERGAPADVFAAASPAEPTALHRKGLCGRPVTFATNRLVLLIPRSNPGHVRSVFDLRNGRRRLAVGAAGVPVGDYTRRLLARLRMTSILSTNAVSNEPNVGGIVAKVGLAAADAGFAYFTDARAARDRVRSIALPQRAQPRVSYQVCAVRRRGVDARGARDFIARVRSSHGRRILKAHGFGLPKRR